MTIFPGPRTCKVTHMSHPDPCAEADFSFGLDSMEFGQDAARIWSQCGQDLAVAKWRRTRKKRKKNQTCPSAVANWTRVEQSRQAHHRLHFSKVNKKTRTYFAMVIRPTLFSGLLRVFEWQTMLTASCCACSLVGKKSPFLIYSLLSTLRGERR